MEPSSGEIKLGSSPSPFAIQREQSAGIGSTLTNRAVSPNSGTSTPDSLHSEDSGSEHMLPQIHSHAPNLSSSITVATGAATRGYLMNVNNTRRDYQASQDEVYHTILAALALDSA